MKRCELRLGSGIVSERYEEPALAVLAKDCQFFEVKVKIATVFL